MTPGRYLLWRFLGGVQLWAIVIAEWCSRRRRRLMS
jgi:hypothetical protein